MSLFIKKWKQKHQKVEHCNIILILNEFEDGCINQGIRYLKTKPFSYDFYLSFCVLTLIVVAPFEAPGPCSDGFKVFELFSFFI